MSLYYNAVYSNVVKSRGVRVLAYLGLGTWFAFSLNAIGLISIAVAFGLFSGGFGTFAVSAFICWWLVQNLIVGPIITIVRAWISPSAADRLRKATDIWQ